MLNEATLIVEGGKGIFRTDDTTVNVSEMTFDASRDPKTFDGNVVESFEVGATFNGIWKVGDDSLVWCGSNQERPKVFAVWRNSCLKAPAFARQIARSIVRRCRTRASSESLTSTGEQADKCMMCKG